MSTRSRPILFEESKLQKKPFKFGDTSSSIKKSPKRGWLKKRHFRSPKGVKAFLILFIAFLFFSYQQNGLYDLVKFASPTLNKLENWQRIAVVALINEACPKLLYPLAGWLADAKFGRYRVLCAGICMTWVASIVILLLSVLQKSLRWTPTAIQPLVAVVYSFSAAGTALFHANLIPFGIDQMEDCSSEQMSSFVHWYYWARNINFGVIIQTVVASFSCDRGQVHDYDRLVTLAEVSLLTLAVSILFVYSKDWITDSVIYNPIKVVRVVTAYIVKHNKPMGYRSAYTYFSELRPFRYDFAKKSYGGTFEDDVVEEVVTFWRLMIFFIPVGIFCTLFFMGTYIPASILHHLAVPNGSPCLREFTITQIIQVSTYFVSVPAFEFIICPFFRRHIPQMRVKIGIGMLLLLVAFAYLLAVDTSVHIIADVKNNATFFKLHISSNQICFLFNETAKYGSATHLPLSPYTLVPFMVLLTIAELFILLTVLEFICAQAPASMRSSLISLNFFCYGICAVFLSLFLLPFGFGFKDHLSHLKFSCGSTLLLSVIVVGILGFTLYCVIAKWYKNRQRGGQTNINYQSVIEGYYERMIEDRERRKSIRTEQTSHYLL